MSGLGFVPVWGEHESGGPEHRVVEDLGSLQVANAQGDVAQHPAAISAATIVRRVSIGSITASISRKAAASVARPRS